MLVFVDFEASSLADAGYSIEVGWAMETGEVESHLIRPAPGWRDWEERAAAVHRIDRNELHLLGEPHDHVARLLLTQLQGHDLCASAPSWDGIRRRRARRKADADHPRRSA